MPETSKLVSGIKQAVTGVERNLTVAPRFDTRDARRAGVQAGRDVKAGLDSSAGGGLGRFLRGDGARSAGLSLGREVNAGLESANVGSGVGSSLSRNLLTGAESLGRNLGGAIATGLKATAAVGGTLAAAGIAGALHAGMSRLTAIDDAKFKLQGLGNDAQKVQAIMDNALAAVKGTAFGLDEAATTAASAVAAGIAPGEQLTKYLKLTGDTAAIAGTSLADMGAIFNKVQTSGKAFTGDLNMLSDRGLPIFQWLQDEYGVTGEALAKMVSDGKVDAATFQKVIEQNIGGAAQNMGGSIRGQLSNLKAAYSRFGAELAGPIFSAVSPLTLAFTGAFDKITTAIKPYTAQLTGIIGPWANDLGNKLTAWLDNGGVQKVIDWMGRLVDRVQALRTGEGRSDALTSITSSVQKLGPALQQAGPALQSAGQAAGAFGQAIVAIGPQTLSSVLVPALNLLGGALRFVADNASWAVPLIGGLVAAFAGFRMLEQTVAPIVSALNGAFKIINAPIMLAQTAAIRQQAAAMTQLTAALAGNTVAQGANSAAQTANAATTARGRVAAMASAVASRAAAAAQWLWNAALAANPITLIVAAVVAAGVALWAFFTKTETGRKLWDKIWTGIKAVAVPVWEWIKSTLGKAWEAIQPGLQKLGAIAREAFSTLGNAVKQVWTFIQPAVEWIGRLALSVGKIQFTVAIAAFQALGSVIGWLWQNVVVPAFNGIVATLSTWWNVTKVIWDAATTAIGWVGDKISWLWKNVAVPGFDAIRGAISTFWTGAKVVWDSFTGVLDTIGTKISAFKDGLVGAFNTVRDTVLRVWDKIGGVFDKIAGGAAAVGSFLGLGGGNTGGMVLGGRVLPGYRDGGQISGPGTGTSDSILGFPAMVRVANGEWITNARATEGNLPLLKAINSGVPVWDMLKAALPRFAEGGLVGADSLVNFARGVEGAKYVRGGVNWGDCSGAVSAIANYATGRDPFGSRFATATEGEELAKRGFKPGLGPSGSLRVGWYNGGPAGGHTAATLPDGTHFEMGGARGNGQFGGSAAGAEDSMFTNRMHLPPEAMGGLDGGASTIGAAYSSSGGGSGGGGSYRSATSAELSSSSSKVDSANTTARNADQAVDDATYRQKRAHERLEAAKAKGKGVEDAQHSADVADRELEDAKEAQTRAHQKAADAINADTELRTKGKLDKSRSSSSSGGGGFNGSDLGKTFVSGVLESIGLDGSLFSNPLEWPTVKSLMAGVNFAGGLLANGVGGQGAAAGDSPLGGFANGVADSVGLGDMLTSIGGQQGDNWTAESGSPKLSPGDFNPALSAGGGPSLADSAVNALSAFAPSAPQGEQRAAGDVDNSIVLSGNFGYSKDEMMGDWKREQNARTRSTVKR
ncbi:tape measure protein [Mycolicibacterium cosmeticum]|uniref:tape measure protein n=1 Tax=Mycolicibacterium cosmeticum TaxID=258533 RepID=UPI001F218E5B|nr:tape measure protein [Mycolicibacterium cosmeticum]